MLVVFAIVFSLADGRMARISATTVAYLGLCLLLLTGVLEWQDLLEEKGAWDSLVWFGGLIMLAGQFEKAGFPSAFAHASARVVSGWPWRWALVGFIVIYVYAHYAFASLVAHVTAMFPPSSRLPSGSALRLCSRRSPSAPSRSQRATTHYGTGPAPMSLDRDMSARVMVARGFLVSLVHLAIWLPVGFLWWKILRLW